MNLTIQLFDAGNWIDAAIVTIARPEKGGMNASAIFEYDPVYAFGDVREPVALNYPLRSDLLMMKNWPAFLYDLIPQGNGRKYLLGLLNRADGPAADFDLLRAGAFNPIGRIRIKEAVQYYQQHVDRHDTSNMRDGMTLEEVTATDHGFVERMLVHSMLAAGTTGVQGAAPKFLLTQDAESLWHADGQIADVDAKKHVIVKLPRGKLAVDLKVLRNEVAYLQTAQRMGLNTTQGVEIHGNMLFVPRFDRAIKYGKVERYHQESLASLAEVVGYDHRPDQFTLLNALRNVVSDQTENTIEFLKRDVLNLAMRNTDNHARNTAVQKIDGGIALTPLYDFAPMYLDLEGISRASRWYHPQSRKELTRWVDILTAIDLNGGERDQVWAALHQFGQQLSQLADTMLDCGVDADIVEFLKPAIQHQRDLLLEIDQQDPSAQPDPNKE